SRTGEGTRATSHMSGGAHMWGGGHMSGGAHMSGGDQMAGSGPLSDEKNESDGGDGSAAPTAGPGLVPTEKAPETSATASVPGAAAVSTAPTKRTIDGPEADPVDLMAASGGGLLWPAIAVLQDDMTGSSGEAVVTAFRGLDGVESFSVPSAGYTSGNAVHRLHDGAMLAMTTSVYVDRDGVSLDEKPIRPDHETSAEAAEETALEWLADQGCQG
uniref:S41 family peptidase n=1 Tax=Nocardiopsis listeri TaxID=53440 RepID=UPI000AE28285